MLSEAVHEYAIGCIGQGITESDVVQAYAWVRPHNWWPLMTLGAPSQNVKTLFQHDSTTFKEMSLGNAWNMFFH
jgi:hypothetical protein